MLVISLELALQVFSNSTLPAHTHSLVQRKATLTQSQELPVPFNTRYVHFAPAYRTEATLPQPAFLANAQLIF